MNKKISLGIAIALMALVAAVTFIISTGYSMTLYNSLVADVQQRAEMYTKLEQIDTYVRTYYNGKIDENDLIEALADAYVDILGDDYSKYYNETEYTLYKEHLSGTHLGIGIYSEEVGGYPQITDVISNSPAEGAGIAIGESIVEINGKSVLEMGYKTASALLTTEAGTPLVLKIRSSGADRTVSVSTVKMTIASVKTAFYNDYGYIKVHEFSEKTFQQFNAAYTMLKSAGVKGIIIDLRNNQGMIYEPVFNLLNELLPKDSVCYTKTDFSGKQTTVNSTSGSWELNVPIVCIVNSRTSGPAELLAASLRDGVGASIVGATSHGNAQYTELYPLYDNTAISLPSHTLQSEKTSYNGVGIKPDFEVLMTNDTNKDLLNYTEQTDGCIRKSLEILSQK